MPPLESQKRVVADDERPGRVRLLWGDDRQTRRVVKPIP